VLEVEVAGPAAHDASGFGHDSRRGQRQAMATIPDTWTRTVMVVDAPVTPPGPPAPPMPLS
jgi:hypothetical protein